jgi:excisionase family DNA binding protein
MGAEERLLKVEDVTNKLGLNRETIRRWIRGGKIKGIKIGADAAGYRIPEREVHRILQGVA